MTMVKRNLNKKMDTLFPQPDPDHCRVCGEEVVDGRWSYCSVRCREIANAVQRMFLWTKVREKILERDDYTCQVCGVTKTKQWEAYHHTQQLIDERRAHLRDNHKEWKAKGDMLREKYDVESPTDGFLHVDHIERVADGGHPFDESNLQTLCRHCHTEKTAEENTSDDRTKQPDITLQDYFDDSISDENE